MDRPAEPFDPEILHRHAPGLRALVRTLVLDDHRVEDVVQETWLAALKRPPQQEEKAGAWLAVVARRIAQRGKREHARRTEREGRAAKPEGLPSAQEIVAREMARRELVDVVLELDEPYRSTVLLRYFEDLAPQEIATRIGAPLETVRTRLKRGLERLREKLDRQHDGDAKAWHLALLPLANLPLGPAAPLVPVGEGPVGEGPVGAGEGALGTGAASTWSATAPLIAVAAVASALGAVAVGWLLFGGGERESGSGAGAKGLAALEHAAGAPEADAAVDRRDGDLLGSRFGLLVLRERETGSLLSAVPIAAADAASSVGSREGWLWRFRDRSEARGEEARATALGASDARGRVSYPLEQGARFPVVLDPRWSPALPPEALQSESDLVLERAGVLHGRVRAEGSAAQRALEKGTAIVRLVPIGTRDGRLRIDAWDAVRGARGVRVARDGAFAFEGLPLDLSYRLEVYASDAGLALAECRELSADAGAANADTTNAGARVSVDVVWPASGARVAGYVSGVEGFPIAGARVALYYEGNASEQRGRGEHGFGPLEAEEIARVAADDGGLFAFAHLPDGRYRIEVHADGFEPILRRVLGVEEGVSEPLSLRLEIGAAIEGVARDERGEPCSGALVGVRAGHGEQHVRTDAEGRFRLSELGAGEMELFARGENGVAARQNVRLLRGETSWIELALTAKEPRTDAPEAASALAHLRGRVVERGTDRGLAGAQIELEPWRSRGFARFDRPRAVLSDAAGAFELGEMPAGRWNLLVSREGYGESAFEVEIAASGSETVLELARSARLSGVVRDRDGHALVARRVMAFAAVRGIGPRVAESDARGRFAFVDLAPGEWSLAAPSANEGPERSAETGRKIALEPGADAREDLVVDVLPEGRSTLVVRCELEGSFALELRGSDASLAGIARPGRVERGEVARFSALPMGRYGLIASASDGVLRLFELEVTSAASELVLGAQSAPEQRLAAKSKDGAPLEVLWVSAGSLGFAPPLPLLGPPGREMRGPQGRRAAPLTAVQRLGGTWNLHVLARDERGRLFRGMSALGSGEAAGPVAGSSSERGVALEVDRDAAATLEIELEPVPDSAPEERDPSGSPARGSSRRR